MKVGNYYIIKIRGYWKVREIKDWLDVEKYNEYSYYGAYYYRSSAVLEANMRNKYIKKTYIIHKIL